MKYAGCWVLPAKLSSSRIWFFWVDSAPAVMHAREFFSQGLATLSDYCSNVYKEAWCVKLCIVCMELPACCFRSLDQNCEYCARRPISWERWLVRPLRARACYSIQMYRPVNSVMLDYVDLWNYQSFSHSSGRNRRSICSSGQKMRSAHKPQMR